MTELEKNVQKLTTSGMIKFYCTYVDDTLLLVKPAEIAHIYNLFKKIDETLGFRVDGSENEEPHLLDIKISALGLTFTERTSSLDSALILKVKLLEITKSAGFEALL